MNDPQFNETFEKAYNTLLETPDIAIKEACYNIANDCLDKFKGQKSNLRTLHDMQDYIKDKYKIITVWRKMKYVKDKEPITYNVIELYELGYVLHFKDSSLIIGEISGYSF